MLSFFGANSLDFLLSLDIIMIFFDKYIDFSMIDYDHASLFFNLVKILYPFIFFIDNSDQFQSNLILKLNRKIRQKKYTFFDYFYISFKNKIFLDRRIHIFQKFSLLIFIQRGRFQLIILYSDVVLHFLR